MFSPNQDLNLGPPTYHAETLSIELLRLSDTRTAVHYISSPLQWHIAKSLANVCYRFLNFLQTLKQGFAQVGSKGNSSHISPTNVEVLGKTVEHQ